MRPAARLPTGLLVTASLLASSGCYTRPIDHEVYDRKRITVTLRAEKKGFSLIERGYEHPFTISGVRMAHILSRMDLRRKSGKGKARGPAIPTDQLYPIGEAVSKAFEQANPDQFVLVMSIRRSKRLGLFDRKYLTSFIAYKKEDLIYIQMGLSDWEIPPYREERLPVPELGAPVRGFQLIDSEGMTVVDAGTAAVEWRDPIFARATRTRITPGGRVVRREILMESPEEEPEELRPEPAPTFTRDLTPETLRALADLEDARRRGDVTQAEYELERRRILRDNGASPRPAGP